MQFRTKIFIGAVLAAIVSLVASELWLAGQVREERQRNLVEQLTAQANLIALSLQTTRADVDFDELAHDVGRVAEGRVTLIAADGKVLGDSTQTPEERAALDNHGTRPEVLAARARGVGQVRRYSDTVDIEMLYVAVIANHPVVHYVRLGMPATEVDAELTAMRRISLVTLAVGVPVAILVAWLSTAPLARRVQAIAGAAQALKAGDLGEASRDFGDDELGSVVHALDDVARELSHRVRDLSQDRARIDAIVAGMVEGVLVVDDEGHIQRINAAARRMLGVGEGVAGRPFTLALRDSSITDLLARAMEGRADQSAEVSLQRDPSRTIVAGAAGVPSDRGGGAVIVLHDISDIRRVDRMRQDFVANVSHELRTPLTVIRGYAESLADGSVEGDDVAEFGSVITRHATKMERLVADLLRLARLDAHQEALTLAACDLKGVFEGIVQDLKPLLESKAQQVVIHVAPGAGSVVVDGAKIHDVIRNLVENAVTYSPESAEIRLEAWVADGTARLTVADNGPGIPVEELPRIFERFYRVDPSRARPGGTGLGLAIVKHLVELHGGHVTAANSALGGAVFTVVLPLRTQPVEAQERVTTA